jgi:GNAT superfamily N-acetyltransferase
MTLNIRQLTTADEPFLWEMLYLSLFVPKGVPPFPRDILQEPAISRYVEGWSRSDDCGFLALDCEKPIGAAWLRGLWKENKGYGYFDDQTPELSMALLPEYRGQGIGSKLLAQIVELAQNRYPALSLSVSVKNPARRLYERFGFLVVKQIEGSLIMVKWLNHDHDLPALPANHLLEEK